jgi:hypothetical protein
VEGAPVADDFEALAETVRRACPGSRLELATDEQLGDLRRDYPGAPTHYTEFLRRVGWGSVVGGGNFMIYSGLVEPADIFDAATAAGLPGLLLLGDDFGGWVLGFDTRAGWRLVGVDNGSAPEPLEQRTLAAFVAQRVADAQDAEPDGV